VDNSPRRVAVAVLDAPTWSPPGIDTRTWQLALAEDVLDVLATLAQVDADLAVTDPGLLVRVGWPGLRQYVVPRLDVPSLYRAAELDGYDQAVLLMADTPDLPGMLLAKLLRPLTTKALAAAPAQVGLLGLAARLPAPSWLPAAGLHELTPQDLRRLAPASVDVAPAPGWHRLRAPEDLARLDPGLEGWDATRALLEGRAHV
jgi:hypothetical protein